LAAPKLKKVERLVQGQVLALLAGKRQVTPISRPRLSQSGLRLIPAPAAGQPPPPLAGANSSTLDAVNRRRSVLS